IYLTAMPLQRIATLLHVSDLHCGPVDPKTMDSRIPALWQKLPWFDGLFGHSYHAMVKLERFHDRTLADEAPVLLVTGDITACGSEDEYSTAHVFLSGELTPPKGNHIGLRTGDWNRLAVSGNHDNWPGSPTIWGSCLTCKSEVFRKMPYFEPRVLILP